MTIDTKTKPLTSKQMQALRRICEAPCFANKRSGFDCRAADALEDRGLITGALKLSQANFSTGSATMTRFYTATDAGRALVKGAT